MHLPLPSSIHLHQVYFNLHPAHFNFHPPPPIIHPHPANFSFNLAPSISTHLHSPPLSSFQAPVSFFQHPERYENQNITCNLAIFPNLVRKIQSCSFCMKNGIHDILQMLFPNPHLELRKSDPKIRFPANLCRKSQSNPF